MAFFAVIGRTPAIGHLRRRLQRLVTVALRYLGFELGEGLDDRRTIATAAQDISGLMVTTIDLCPTCSGLSRFIAHVHG
ncbi:hypothetical protein [Sphingobium sp. CFD-1]|uniref:hypothetical protein n=1 Tax=Sphingobium sp. CFD-1 TaxID=2878545 RepID=UPI00214AEA82|nr:hypothetical protein [Sphingobium sp. CFD-1]